MLFLVSIDFLARTTLNVKHVQYFESNHYATTGMSMTPILFVFLVFLLSSTGSATKYFPG
jgi:hypothetical protein